MLHKPAAMVVLASEQVWPNIQGLVYWQEQAGGLRDLCIYHTADEARSKRPADRLENLCQSLYGGSIQVHRLNRPGDVTPQAVAAQVRAWRQALPGRRWVLNATGGVKLMSVGLMALADQDETEVVYRELNRQWYRVRKTEELRADPLEPPIDGGVTDQIPVLALVQSQWDAPQPMSWTAEEVERIEVGRVVQEGCRTGWDWERALRAGGATERIPQSGMLFEVLMAGALKELGIPNVVRSLKLTDEKGTVLQEIDVAANFRGRLLLVDCKLMSKEDEGKRVEKLTSQIRQAENTRRALGGLGAAMLLVRPNRYFSSTERALLEAYHLEVIDAGDSWKLFTRLAEFAQVAPLPPSWEAAEELLTNRKNTGCAGAFSRPARLASVEGIACHSLVEVNPQMESSEISRLLSKLKLQREQDWEGQWDRDASTLTLLLPAIHADVQQTQTALKDLLQQYHADIIMTKPSHSRKSVRAVVNLKGANVSALVQYLNQHPKAASLLGQESSS